MSIEFFSWVQDKALRAAFDFTMNGGALLRKDAKYVLGLLKEESSKNIKKVVGDDFFGNYYPSARYGNRWRTGCPKGVVDHYTAGVGPRGALMWFSNMPREQAGSNSSAHAVIDRDGTIFIVIDPLRRVAWHASGANNTSVGIEHVNAGLLLRKQDGKFYYLDSREYPEDRTGDLQEVNSGEFWEPYTVAQLVSNIMLKRWLIRAFPENQLREELFVDHQEIDPGRKIDCGPLWPLFELNEIVFSWLPIRGMKWAKKEILLLKDVEEFKKESRDLCS